MKFVGIVGSNADLSYNRKLLQFIKTQYQNLFELDVVEIKDIPMIKQIVHPFKSSTKKY